ncbi:hypothetical protein [Glycomyces artemisiae]|uniref:hypothetical protein n=1 Tax=Glycomyces artemisiae TaxID=1076443 RepID=UPI000D0832F6|nr:hypothetical protein [Glycomyces artemisiae]
MIDRGTLDCPVDDECASCSKGGDLAVYEADTVVGVICLTLCERCADRGELPRISVGGGARMVLEHCEHRGVDLDYDVRRREAEEERWR